MGASRGGEPLRAHRGVPGGSHQRYRSVLHRAARELTVDVSLAEDAFATLDAGLDRSSLIDLFLTIAFYNGVVRVLAALEVDVEDSYLPYLNEFPLPD